MSPILHASRPICVLASRHRRRRCRHRCCFRNTLVKNFLCTRASSRLAPTYNPSALQPYIPFSAGSERQITFRGQKRENVCTLYSRAYNTHTYTCLIIKYMTVVSAPFYILQKIVKTQENTIHKNYNVFVCLLQE